MRLFKSKTRLKILFVGSEAAPFAKIGGLGSVLNALPQALCTIGHDARIMIPRYLAIDTEEYPLTMEKEGLRVSTGNTEGEQRDLICNVKRFSDSNGDTPITYFLENQEYYEQRANVYGYADDPIRWALLSRGVLEFLKVSDWIPDVIVANDWPTGFLPNYLKTVYKNDRRLSKIASVFIIHNLSHQGTFDHNFVQEMDIDDGHSPIPGFADNRILKINGMRRGIMYADVITTVSPTYAKEIMTPEYGQKLDDILWERRAFLYGILNGIDYKIWDSELDSNLAMTFSAETLEARSNNKIALQDRFNLPTDKKTFVLSIISRLTKQKGLDLLYPVLETMLQQTKLQLIIVGEGESDFMGFFSDLEKRYPAQVAAHLKFDQVLPRIVLGGADGVLIPSRFEPSGLVQMEAMRYGTIPIARKTGGLADTVEDYSPEMQTGTGFTFERFDSFAMATSVLRALETFRYLPYWQALQARAMEKDFSWERSAKEYSKLFYKAVEVNAQKKSR